MLLKVGCTYHGAGRPPGWPVGSGRGSLARMPAFLALPLALWPALTGCNLVVQPLDLEEELDLDFDGGATAGGMEVQAVEPTWGLTSGGTDVVITGLGFDPSTRVFFGGAEATLIQGYEDELTVSLPAVTDPGLVDVKVEGDAGSVTLPGSFRYLRDGAGLAGVVGYVDYSEYVGDYWSDLTEPWASAAVTFVDPLDFAWQDTYAVGTDQCQLDYDWDGTLTIFDAGVAQIELSAGTSTFVLPWSEANSFFTAELSADDFAFASGYDLEPVQPAGLPAVEVEDLARTPSSSFTVLSPDIEGSVVTYVDPVIPLSWAGGGGDLVLVTIGLRNAAGSDYDAIVTCVANNDGAFTVPDLWPSWPSFRQVDIQVSMVRETDATLDLNGSGSAVVGMYTKLGAAFSY